MLFTISGRDCVGIASASRANRRLGEQGWRESGSTSRLPNDPLAMGYVFPTAAFGGCKTGPMTKLELVALVVRDYDLAIRFFVDVLQFELLEDTPSLTNDGRPKRWVVVKPVGAETGILLARADGEEQAKAIGQQFAGRVGLFLRVDDFDACLPANGRRRCSIRVIAANRAVRRGRGVPRPRRQPVGLARSASSQRRLWIVPGDDGALPGWRDAVHSGVGDQLAHMFVGMKDDAEVHPIDRRIAAFDLNTAGKFTGLQSRPPHLDRFE